MTQSQFINKVRRIPSIYLKAYGITIENYPQLEKKFELSAISNDVNTSKENLVEILMEQYENLGFKFNEEEEETK